MKKTIITLIVTVGLLVGLAFLISGNENVTEGSGSAITLSETSYDFGQIDIFGGKVSHDFILTNEGEEDVVVTAGTTSCGCTEGSLGGMMFGMHSSLRRSVIIPAGESMPMAAIYDPLAHGPNGTGKITRELMLQTNSRVTPELNMRISADVYKNE